LITRCKNSDLIHNNRGKSLYYLNIANNKDEKQKQ
jgi:hypothetical protein